MLFVSLCRCGEKRFVFTRREQSWGEGVTEQRLLNGTCPGTSGWNLEARTWNLEDIRIAALQDNLIIDSRRAWNH